MAINCGTENLVHRIPIVLAKLHCMRVLHAMRVHIPTSPHINNDDKSDCVTLFKRLNLTSKSN